MPAASRNSKRATQRTILAWFGTHRRSFPWRATRDPYKTLVAEVMLQQTQTSRVVRSYRAFLAKFPTAQRLAVASKADVIRAWQGLGYNNRALRLQQAATQLVERFPRDPAELKKLPGIGEYTANAIACFAFDRQVAVLDTNVNRVLGRFLLGAESVQPKLATDWLPARKAYEWNQALMDIGATICTARAPQCDRCPLARDCRFKGRAPASRTRPKQPQFEGSTRQARGRIIDRLRTSDNGATVAQLAEGRDLEQTHRVLQSLEHDGLVTLSKLAREGNPRGRARLPR